MEPTWTASLSLGSEEHPAEIHQMHFFTQDSQQQPMPPESRLSFLSFVQCSRIPLHIVTGPPYEVITARSTLLESIATTIPSSSTSDSPEQLPHSDTVESDIGALLRVEFVHTEGNQVHAGITELLLYASAAFESEQPSAGSRTAIWNGSQQDPLRQVRFFALPLSSNLLFKPNLWDLPPTLPNEEQSSIVDATVLQPPDLDRSKKRQRLNSLFQDAAKTRRKTSRQDSQDLARLLPSRPESPLDVLDDNQRSRNGKPKPLHARTQSLGSLSETRPHSREHPIERVRSSLSRADSPNGTTTQQDVDAMNITESSSATEERNKKTLSTVVMAGMRMRGMCQKKRRLNESALEADDLEYKLMYRNTFKAASFALRDRLRQELSSEGMRDVVDILLDLFCTSGTVSAGFDVTH